MIKSVFLSAFVFLLCSTAVSQDTTSTENAAPETSIPAVLRVWFRDAERGTAVRPDAILLDGRPIFPRVDETGHVDIMTTEGDHQLGVRASGYDPLDSRQTAFSFDAPMNVIMLDPVQKTPELRPENLSRFMSENSSLIVGFVVDEELSRAIEDAEVEIVDSEIKTKTDARGFFALQIPLTEGTPMPDDAAGRKFRKVSFRVTKDGFGYEERLNVAVETGSPKMFQIRMIPGGGGNTLDEETERGGLQSWVFGIPPDQQTTGAATAEDNQTTAAIP